MAPMYIKICRKLGNNYGIGFRVRIMVVRYRVRVSVRFSDTQRHYSAVVLLCVLYGQGSKNHECSNSCKRVQQNCTGDT